MNYITEINRFYDWLETNQVPKSAIALWHALMHIDNKTGWEQKFTVAISTIESKTGFKRSELNEARNILKQKGRINWRPRGGNLCAEYEIISFCGQIADTKAYTKLYTNPDTITPTEPTEKLPINKQEEIKPKQTKPIAADKPAAEKKDEPVKVLYWGKIVETWFSFYKKYYLIDPTFTGAAAKNLKLIIDRLKALSEKMVLPADRGPVIWSEDYAIKIFTKFLEMAISDTWIRDNFLLSNLYSKFDSIIQKSNGNGNGKITGASVNTGSAFDKIDAMPD